jgi:hypothetical protein
MILISNLLVKLAGIIKRSSFYEDIEVFNKYNNRKVRLVNFPELMMLKGKAINLNN